MDTREIKGPFYHGTKVKLDVGGYLTAGHHSNYRPNVIMNHIYFTTLKDGAGLAAALAKGNGREYVYQVEPLGEFEDDPNVTDKKFPGNPTKSYRSTQPLKIVAQVTDYQSLSKEERAAWKERLAVINTSDDKIIN
ncbi:NAD(+)--rifampin ADP-ribosyltransferase [Enterococcus hermanniensis]|nr:NAD(+)--rifampin ADP-ribosyltransferase [Enterococcus hermanniensis]